MTLSDGAYARREEVCLFRKYNNLIYAFKNWVLCVMQSFFDRMWPEAGKNTSTSLRWELPVRRGEHIRVELQYCPPCGIFCLYH